MGNDSDALASVDVRTRKARENQRALPELSHGREAKSGGAATLFDGPALTAEGEAASSCRRRPSVDVNSQREKHAKREELAKIVFIPGSQQNRQ